MVFEFLGGIGVQVGSQILKVGVLMGILASSWAMMGSFCFQDWRSWANLAKLERQTEAQTEAQACSVRLHGYLLPDPRYRSHP